MMSIQEQEHWDHEAGSASELQNCLSEARTDLSRQNFTESEKVCAHLAQKLFVVVQENTYYCRATDAIAGVSKTFDSAHESREAAQVRVATIIDESQGESSAYVLPRLPDPAPAPPCSCASCDDIPF